METRAKHIRNTILFYCYLFVCSDVLCAIENNGLPPFQVIEIPYSPYGEHFDLERDNDGTLYIAYMHGVKIYNGDKWINLKIPDTNGIRRLYFDGRNRIYIGGQNAIGYIQKNETGQYIYSNILPSNLRNKFESVWTIIACNDTIYFRDVHDVLSFQPSEEKKQHWHFDAKTGAMACYQNQPIIQNREIGLFQLVANQWVTSDIKLQNNEFIYYFSNADDGSTFLLSEGYKWRILKNRKIKELSFNEHSLSLIDYVSIAPLKNNKYVLGSSNGLITFIDTKTSQQQSFQLTNDWIARIIPTQDNHLFVLTEFEIYIIQWPSAIRVKGKGSGLASNIYNFVQWNQKDFVLSSAGVFLYDQNQYKTQKRPFKKLNWTNMEGWNLLPLNKSEALLAESHRILLVYSDLSRSSHSISQIIYPRKFYPSRFHPEITYVVTETSVERLIRDGDTWEMDKIFQQRPSSLLELSTNSLLLSTEFEGLLELTINPKTNQIIDQSKVETLHNLSNNQTKGIKFFTSNAHKIYAYNSFEIYELLDNKFKLIGLNDLKSIIGNQNILGMDVNNEGEIFAFTYSKIIYLNHQNKWQATDLSSSLRGIINNITLVNNTVKVLSNGQIINFSPNKYSMKRPEFKLLLTQVMISNKDNKKRLPLKSLENQEFQQDFGDISFSFILNDLANLNKVQYRYRLMDYDEDWSEYTTDTHIIFKNLPAGSYRFEVEALENKQHRYYSRPYTFIIKPHWYATMLAKIIWFSMLILALYLFGRAIAKWRERKFYIQKQTLKNEIRKKTTELQKANEHLKIIANLDGLTGLYNRLYLDQFIENLLDENPKTITVMMLDMDYFKEYNDQYGHLSGDELLKKVARHLKSEVNRLGDIIARYGGEEFIILMIDAQLSYATEKAEKIRKLIENKKNKTSISIGISHSKELSELKSTDKIYQFIDQADKALYQAKKQGRNSVYIY